MKARMLVGVALVALSLVAVAPAATPTHVFKIEWPGDVGVGYGSVWVLDHREGSLYRLNPKTNSMTGVVVGESLCSIPVFGASRVWVWGCDSNTTYGIDPSKNKVVAKRRGSGPVYGAGSLWTFDSNNKILRVDPRSGVVIARINPGIDITNGGPDMVAYGSLWVSGDTAVSRIDVNTNKVTRVIPLAGAKPSGDVGGGNLGVDYAAAAGGEVWNANAAGLYEIDPRSNRATLIPIRLKPLAQFGDIPVVTGQGSIWLRTGNTTITRINPANGRTIGTYPAAGGGGGYAVGYGSLWVANFGDHTVWREPIH